MKLTKTEKSFTLVFCVLLIAEFIASTNYPLLRYFTKPAILIALIIFYLKQKTTVSHNVKLLILGALTFSLLGDILLLFVDKSAHFFTFGLVAFLTAHILYILVFLKQRNKAKKPYIFSLFLFAFGGLLFYFLKDNLDAMFVPVILYMTVILSMAITAYLRQGIVSKKSYIFVFIGATLFMISDSLLAIDKFHNPLMYSNISIMFTYAFAQLFIVFGLLKQR
ncbi:lysoplasmalogenase [Bizionia argentinensis JUB59]|uniref:Lysoplasmalogenase n=1 Tax=Bizionia argentinensis JUB59 TaxID=1046627 RepID=G2EBD8_9FLAO|nr:lysoplasmalogenase [Bizionia argentinensis]EGV44278.1 lysoplasmalogenase [Bizionia argentinensis JUB59]